MGLFSKPAKTAELENLTKRAEEARARTRWTLREQLAGEGFGYAAALREERAATAAAAALYRELSGEG
jgi:hypothetical protein